MANEQHVQWLLEGVASWNRRRESDPFTPDLSDIILPEHFPVVSRDGEIHRVSLSGANLSHANLDGSNLAYADFVGSDFTGAYLRVVYASQSNFSGSNFANADLTDFVGAAADFSDANFSGANLTRANLRNSGFCRSVLADATFTYTVLDDADLSGTSLARTNFVEASLLGVKFYGAEPSLATFFPADDTSLDKVDCNQVVIERVSDLLTTVSNFGYRNSIYYRGEPALGLRLSPSVIRDGLSDYEGDMLLELISHRPQELSSMTTVLEQWVLARHHGLKTRFLDVTKNPLVGLYFACAQDEKYDDQDSCLHIFGMPEASIKTFSSDTISVIANFARLRKREQELLLFPPTGGSSHIRVAREFHAALARLYQLVGREKIHFEERIDVKDLYGVFIVEPQLSSERVRAQAGAFLVSAFRDRFDYPAGTSWNGGVRPYGHCTLLIPNCRKRSILRELRTLHVTEETLFPGLDSAAAAVTAAYSEHRDA